MMFWRKKTHTIQGALAKGFAVSFAGILACLWSMPANIWTVAPEGNQFVRRWDGSCGGWTRELAALHLVADLGHWIAYVTICFVLLDLHPVMKGIPGSRWTLYLMGAFVFGCGVTHLLSAYSVLNPIYVFGGWFKLVNAIVSYVAAVAIAYSLVRAFAVVVAKRKRAEELEQRFGAGLE